MITTRNINVNLDKGKLKLRHITTKDINVGVRVEPPKVPIKTKSISTTTLGDVAAIAEKKRRDDIMAERKLAMKDEKKIVIEKKEVEVVEPSKELTEEKIIEPVKIPAIGGEMLRISNEDIEKKPWKLMTDDEKKIAIKERTAKMMATKARKKKEKEK